MSNINLKILVSIILIYAIATTHYSTLPINCPTCELINPERIYIVACNTGNMSSLDIAAENNPRKDNGYIIFSSYYDNLSQTNLNIIKDPSTKISRASLRQQRNIISLNNMCNTFCANCRKKIFTAIKGQNISSFVLFIATNEPTFYPIADGTQINLDPYQLEIKQSAENDNLEIILLPYSP